MARTTNAPAGGTHRRVSGLRGARVWFRRRVTWGRAVWRRVSVRPGAAHLIRGLDRFNDRLGSQFAGAITYFSFLSLVPILMVAFSVAGFVLAAQPGLLAALKGEVTSFMPSKQLAGSIGTIIDQAVGQSLTVGIVGLLIAAYSGLNWMGNVRDAVRAQWRPRWDRSKDARGNFWMAYVWDLVSLLGLLAAVLLSFALTAVGTAAQDLAVGWSGIPDSGPLRQLLRIGPFAVAICADMVIFGWLYTILPHKQYRAGRRTLLIGALAMSVSFEVLKAALAILVTRMSSSPTGVVFGAVIGLLLFFNLVARAFLMVAAWIATGDEDAQQRATASATATGPATGVAVERSGGDEPAGQRARPRVPPVTGDPIRTVSAGSPAPRALAAAFGSGALVGWLVGRGRGGGRPRRRDRHRGRGRARHRRPR